MPAARHTDPETSHDAAKSVRNQTATHAAIRHLMRKFGPLTDTDLISAYRAEWGAWAPFTDSGLRTRRAELVELGHVVDTGARQKLASGRQSIVWGLREDEDGQ